MSPILRDWLNTCPDVREVSTLAVDAHRDGLIDLPEALARAVALHVRLTTLAPRVWPYPPRHRERALRAMAAMKRCRVEIAGATAVLAGIVNPAVRISQSAEGAVMLLKRRLPETIVAALPGRPLDELIDYGLMSSRGYVVHSAGQGADGLWLRFRVPSVPVEDALRGVSRGRAAR